MGTRTDSAGSAKAAAVNATFDDELEERFLRYVRVDTQSDEKSTTSPSTEKQYHLLRLLADELKSIGAEGVKLTDYGAVLATIPATHEADAPTIALLAHVDTAPQFSEPASSPSSIATTREEKSSCRTLRASCCRPRCFPIWRQRSARISSPPAGPRFWAPTTKRGSRSS